jgi:hypothetical protein
VIQPTTVRLPPIGPETRPSISRVRARCRRAPRTRRMRAMLVVVLLELDKLPLEISRGPEQQAIQAFAPYGPNQPFDDGMGARHVRHRLDLTDVEDPQVRLPLMKPYSGSWSALR